MDCACSSCVRLGLALPRHVGDCELCNADGDTVTTAGRELCPACASSHTESEVEDALAERAYDRAADGDRCWRGHAE